jgi:hypothetical protein
LPRAYEERLKSVFIRAFNEEFKTCNRKFWKKANLSTEAPTGQPGGEWFTVTFERQMEAHGNAASLIK